MNLQDCIQFATENPFPSVATMEGDQPRVRTLMLDWADETGFYFAVLSPKAVYRQLKEHPKVEICFFNHASDLGQVRQMRLTGVVDFPDNQMVRQKALQARAGLDQIVGKPLEPLTEIFRVKSGEIHFWTMMDILKEPQLERVKF